MNLMNRRFGSHSTGFEPKIKAIVQDALGSKRSKRRRKIDKAVECAKQLVWNGVGEICH